MSTGISNRTLIFSGVAAAAAGLGLYLLYRSRQQAPLPQVLDGETKGEEKEVVVSEMKEVEKIEEITNVKMKAHQGPQSHPKKKLQVAKKNKKNRKTPLDKERLCALFTDIVKHMQTIVMQLAHAEQQIKAQADVPEDELAKYMMIQFENAMKTIELQLYEKYDTTEAEAQEVAKLHEEDSDFKPIVKKLQAIYSAVSGQMVTVDIPDFLTLELMSTIMEKIMQGMTFTMETLVNEVRAELGPDVGKEELVKVVNKQYTARVEALRNQLFDQSGLTQDVMQAALVKYQHNAEFAAKMEELTQAQKEKFVELGIVDIDI